MAYDISLAKTRWPLWKRNLYNSQQIDNCKDDNVVTFLKALMLMKYKIHTDKVNLYIGTYNMKATPVAQAMSQT